MDTINDQENIKRIQQVDSRTRMILKTGPDRRAEEWKQIRKEMKAGSSDLTQEDINYFEDKSSMAQVLHTLWSELQVQGNIVTDYDRQDWHDSSQDIAQGWCEALEFAIKVIERHNRG